MEQRKTIVPDGTKFQKLPLARLPSKIRSEVQDFIEDMDGFGMLSRAALRNMGELPKGTKLYLGDDLLEASDRASRGYGRKLLGRGLLRIIGCEDESPRPDFILHEGLDLARLAAERAGRIYDILIVQRQAELVAARELARKTDLETGVGLGIIASAGFLAVMKAVKDLNFTAKEEFIAHAEERWKIAELGFGIQVYDGYVPYLFCLDKEGSTRLLRNERFHGPFCAP